MGLIGVKVIIDGFYSIFPKLIYTCKIYMYMIIYTLLLLVAIVAVVVLVVEILLVVIIY